MGRKKTVGLTGNGADPDPEPDPNQQPEPEPVQGAEPESQPESESISLERDHPEQTTLADMEPVKPKRKYTKRTEKKPDPAQARADRALLARAFEGTFQALGMALGPHWALNPAREVDGQKYPAEGEVMADAWQPVFDRYGGKITGEALMWVSASTVTVAIMAPRIRQSVAHESGLIGWIKRKLAARRSR